MHVLDLSKDFYFGELKLLVKPLAGRSNSLAPAEEVRKQWHDA